MSYGVLLPVFTFAALAFLFLCAADKALIELNKLGFRKEEFADVKRFKFLFPRRKDGRISKFVFTYTLLFYLVTSLAILTLIIHFINGLESTLLLSALLFGLNVFVLLRVLFLMSLQSSLLFDKVKKERDVALMIKKGDDPKKKRRKILLLLSTVENLVNSNNEKNRYLNKRSSDHITTVIADEWGKEFMDLVHMSFEQNILDRKQLSMFEDIKENFTKFSEPPFYEEGIWTVEGLKDHSFWNEQRTLAQELLAELERILSPPKGT